MNKNNLILIILVSSIILAARLIPHVPNFSPLVAVLLFSGVYAKNKLYLILPLIALFASDILIGFYKWEIMLSVYGSLLLIAGLGVLVNKNKNILNLFSTSLGSALTFFLVTNFAVWYFGSWYSHDLTGLNLCYAMAVPFFKQTLLSTLLYSGLLFGSYEGFRILSKEKKLITTK